MGEGGGCSFAVEGKLPNYPLFFVVDDFCSWNEGESKVD